MNDTTTLDVSRKLRDAGIEIETKYFHQVPRWALEQDPQNPAHSLVNKNYYEIVKGEGYPFYFSAPTISELREYIEVKGEWEEFMLWLYYNVTASYRFEQFDEQNIAFANTLTNADSLALAYMAWKERKG